MELNHNDLLRKYHRAIARGNLLAAYNTTLRAARFYEQREDFKQAGIWVRLQSHALYERGKVEESIIAAERSAKIQPDPWERARSLLTLANKYTLLFNKNALITFGIAKEAARPFLSDLDLNIRLTESGGHVYLMLGDIDQAIANYQDAAEVLRQSNDLDYKILAFNNLAFALAHGNYLKEAEKQIMYAQRFLSKSPHRYRDATIYETHGFICMLMGKYREAERYLTNSAKLFERLSDKDLISTLFHLSKLHQHMRNWQMAREESDRALKLATKINSDKFCVEARDHLLNIEAHMSKLTKSQGSFHGMLYASSKMLSIIDRIKAVAPTDDTVLILGETGTGKELFARAIYQESKRRAGPFIAFNASALSREMVESQLFGHRKGAFTDAVQSNEGIVRAAQHGTLFLDEIGDLPLELQPKLLRFLQDGEIYPLGENRSIHVDVRVIAATSLDLERAVAEGKFREDLFYRLNVIRLYIPPLRERTKEIPVLINHYMKQYQHEMAKSEIKMPQQIIDLMVGYDWPGNVRQLCNEIRRIVAYSESGGIVTAEMLSPEILRIFGEREFIDVPAKEIPDPIDSSSCKTIAEAVIELERQMIQDALGCSSGNIAQAAKELGLTRRGLYMKMNRLKLDN